LYYDNKNKDVIAITEDMDLTKPGYYLSVIDPKTGKFVKEIGTERVYADLPAGADAYPMINGFSSVDRQYFVEFEITYKDDKSKNHPDMVAIDIDTGAMVS
jgi:hypothetical protein